MLQGHFALPVHTRGHTARASSLLWYTRGSKRKKLGVGWLIFTTLGFGNSSKLNMATSLRSRSKKKKLILLMVMMLADDSSVSKQVARKSWARLWLLRRQEKGAFYTIFRELSMEDSDEFCEYMRMPYAKFELINFYTFSRRHLEL